MADDEYAAKSTVRRTALNMVCAVALTLCVPAAAEVLPPKPTVAAAPDAVWQRGLKLRAELAAEYKRLQDARKLSNRIGLDNDVTPIVI